MLHRDPEESRNGFDPLELPGCSVIKSYRGERLTDGTHTVTVELNTFMRGGDQPLLTTFHRLASCLPARLQNSARFTWGDDESGSAQLAFVLLFDALQDVDLARRFHPEFQRRVMAGWGDSWSISEQEIRAFVAGRVG